jgi:hypothetical protein
MYFSALGADTVWTQCLGVAGGFMALAAVLPPGAPCGGGAGGTAVPLVQSLTRASSPLGRTPWRYYVVPLQSVTVSKAGGAAARRLRGMPAFLVLDTGTTQCQLPGGAGAAAASLLNGLADGEVAVFRVGVGAAGATTSADIVLRGRAGVTFPTAGAAVAPVFVGMPDSEASMFSSALDVGVLGATAMRGLCIQYNITQRTACFISADSGA